MLGRVPLQRLFEVIDGLVVTAQQRGEAAESGRHRAEERDTDTEEGMDSRAGQHLFVENPTTDFQWSCSKDCALLRVLDGAVCIEEVEGGILVLGEATT